MWTVIDDMLNKFHTVIAWTAMFTYQNIIKVSTVFLPGFSTLGSDTTHGADKGGHEGEKRVTIFRYS